MELMASLAFQAVSWLNLWSTTVGKISLAAMATNTDKNATFLRLLQSGGKTISYLAHLTANMWANWLLKRRDSALSKVSRFVGTAFTLALRNGDILSSSSLFLKDQVDAAVDRQRADSNDRLVLQAVSKSSGSSHANIAKPRSQALYTLPERKSMTGPRRGRQPSPTPTKKTPRQRPFQHCSSKPGRRGRAREGRR